jgi:putative flippase GtrA
MKLFGRLQRILNQQNLWGEIIRYLIIGGIAFAADYSTLLILNKLFNINYLLAASLAFCLGIMVNYLGSIYFVFQVRSLRNPHIERILFLVIGLIGLGINDGMLYLLTGQLLIPIEYSKLITQGFVLFWNFAARKLMLFSRGNHDAY